MFKGFRDFILRGSVVDLAVAFIMGAAFNAIVASLVGDVLNPLIAAIITERGVLRAPYTESLREMELVAG